jgi:uncharacterized protein YqeY
VSLSERINNDLKAAMLGGNRFCVQVLRGLKATILNEEVSSGKRDTGLDDSIIEKLIAKEVKKRNESAEIYEGAGRSELAENERNEAEILGGYLPKQLNEEEIKLTIQKIITSLDASGASAMGQVIGAVKKELGNSADGSIIARLVKEALN